eukprot:TRINITY_DN1037_c0_g1_i3.p1 TRINITY_DN1037_c0_g1~~TRINITY_DN1037_c0_g1_i3.p1  ORF type:complete len:242 (-),score=4.79 TRINITY_DN1037_c0_g1_i3:11-736(-)
MKIGMRKLTARSRLALVLEFLRRHPPQSLLAQRYGISQSTVSRELHHSIPILYIYCRFINWPERPITESWCNAIGAIDCTSHFRCRVHPGQALYYRGDKHGHFITAQVICSLRGEIWSICLGLGHNNDQGFLKLSKKDKHLILHDMILLGDGGYRGNTNIITPDDDKDLRWNYEQMANRAVVEVINSLVKNWKSAELKFSMSPEMQEMTLMVCYNLVAKHLHMFPLNYTITNPDKRACEEK